MKNIRIFLSENFPFWVVKFSIYLNRRVFVIKHNLPRGTKRRRYVEQQWHNKRKIWANEAWSKKNCTRRTHVRSVYGPSTSSVKHHSETHIITDTTTKQSKGHYGNLELFSCIPDAWRTQNLKFYSENATSPVIVNYCNYSYHQTFLNWYNQIKMAAIKFCCTSHVIISHHENTPI